VKALKLTGKDTQCVVRRFTLLCNAPFFRPQLEKLPGDADPGAESRGARASSSRLLHGETAGSEVWAITQAIQYIAHCPASILPFEWLAWAGFAQSISP